MKKNIINFIILLFLTIENSFSYLVSDSYLLLRGKDFCGASILQFEDIFLIQVIGDGFGCVQQFGGDYEISSYVGGFVGKLENNLNYAHCFPNPFKPNSGLGHSKIIFSRLTKRTRLRVYTILGELVYEIEKETPTGELSWDVVNNRGEKLASGVYIYIITDDSGNSSNGRFAVVR